MPIKCTQIIYLTCHKSLTQLSVLAGLARQFPNVTPFHSNVTGEYRQTLFRLTGNEGGTLYMGHTGRALSSHTMVSPPMPPPSDPSYLSNQHAGLQPFYFMDDKDGQIRPVGRDSGDSGVQMTTSYPQAVQAANSFITKFDSQGRKLDDWIQLQVSDDLVEHHITGVEAMSTLNKVMNGIPPGDPSLFRVIVNDVWRLYVDVVRGLGVLESIIQSGALLDRAEGQIDELAQELSGTIPTVANPFHYMNSASPIADDFAQLGNGVWAAGQIGLEGDDLPLEWETGMQTPTSGNFPPYQ